MGTTFILIRWDGVGDTRNVSLKSHQCERVLVATNLGKCVYMSANGDTLLAEDEIFPCQMNTVAASPEQHKVLVLQ